MSVPTETQQWQLDHHPDPKKSESPSNFFTLVKTPLPALGPNSVLVKPILYSNDASQRTWIGSAGSYITVKPGQVMKSFGLAKVIASNKDAFKKGDVVWGMLAWSEYMVFEDPGTQYPLGLTKLTEEQAKNPEEYAAARITGLTAYYGLLKVGEATSSDQTIVVSTAAGATGAVVVQIAKHVLNVPRVIGITGSPDKMELIKSLGCDIALNYKSPTFEDDLAAAVAPMKGIDLYFDNVGGAMLDIMLKRMKTKGRIVACGALGSYDNDNEGEVAYVKELRRIIMAGVRIQGLNVGHYAEDYANAMRNMEQWGKEGKLKPLMTVYETAFSGVPGGMERLLAGKNTGKLLTKIVSNTVGKSVL